MTSPIGGHYFTKEDGFSAIESELIICCQTVPIKERFNGHVVWAGSVLIFDLLAHPKQSVVMRGRTPEGKDDKDTRYVAVLHLPPVDSARKAVQPAIVSQFKSGR